ncbi:putative plus-end-directed kinesin ATPase [Helianthus annuus]|uniref:Kinesin-like protein n=1 Tax=Helianthus annuus TaxID=4232 RepID=A0A251SPF1_HELAN|nr:kinesin-like protein KIN-13B isoform X1 [Helianthus annuus]KAF5776912.1 putative plus-end-directed kinesin ATPase [Helianthus annuus]KAJ0488551.1 putative plus-end-directed kinesin ATPase [Helianthus annuus]KAJ0492081.1 putative plus-end-directed kinesin ATPase [Helianthus annuus]KAJ0504388.1 putative plus-end-directed kinesin ATPase [Helianthus annuus]KAJ0674100.1 putative plus-end-directed kinesin ATPase [Helianthus annuus]
MNAVGRQGQRSGASGAHHQRQYSDNFLEVTSSSSNGRWLQQSSSNNSSQDFGYYGVGGGGGGGQGSRMYNNSRSVGAQRSVSGATDLFAEPLTPPARKKNGGGGGGEDPNGYSPGLLDLHSFDTELISEVPVTGTYGGRSFDDAETYFGNNKQANKARGMPDNNVLKSFAPEKEKTSNVAKIKVVVRKRPLNKKELAKNEEDIITVEPHSNSLTVHETKLKVDLTEYMEKHGFVFDAVLNEEVSNDEVYHETVEPIVPIIFQRTKATCFAYGQTGSGKTFTMKPLPLKASRDILRLVNHTYRSQGFQLYFSFFEIYGGKLFDLLSDRKKLCMREDGSKQVCIVGLQEYKVSDVETIKELIERGNATRSTGTTGANEESSRSHAILQLVVKRSVDGNASKPPRVVGKLSFIDLAGSERGADTTDNDKQTRMEGAEINKSLLALKECIRALDNDQGHIPFRGSKLTEVLRDSFVGNSRTVMISCISPNAGSCEHTLNTLRYADRVKSLSKGNKKDALPSSFKEPTAVSMSTTVLPRVSSYEDNMVDSYPEQADEDDYDTTEEFYEPEQPSWKYNNNNYKVEAYNFSNAQEKNRIINGQTKSREPPKSESRNWNPDDELNALLQEEEDLVNAHRKQVEDTMDIVRVEMNLLVEADEPGNQLDDYVAKLNTLLAQKAATISQLQNRLANFQKRLREHDVLYASGP